MPAKGKVRTLPRSRRVRPYPLPESPASHWSKTIKLTARGSSSATAPTVYTRVPSSSFSGVRSPGSKTRKKPLVKKAGRQKRRGATR